MKHKKLKFPIGLGTFQSYLGIGGVVGATADGRMEGQPVGSNASPSVGRATIVLSVILVLSTPTALAVSQHKHNIKGFEDLDIGTGIRATVVCEDKNQVVVEASEHLLSAIQVKVRDGLLSINRNFSFSDLFDHHHSRDVLVTVTTTRALSDLKGV